MDRKRADSSQSTRPQYFWQGLVDFSEIDILIFGREKRGEPFARVKLKLDHLSSPLVVSIQKSNDRNERKTKFHVQSTSWSLVQFLWWLGYQIEQSIRGNWKKGTKLFLNSIQVNQQTVENLIRIENSWLKVSDSEAGRVKGEEQKKIIKMTRQYARSLGSREWKLKSLTSIWQHRWANRFQEEEHQRFQKYHPLAANRHWFNCCESFFF